MGVAAASRFRGIRPDEDYNITHPGAHRQGTGASGCGAHRQRPPGRAAHPRPAFAGNKKSFRSYLYRDGSAIPFRYEGRTTPSPSRRCPCFQGYAAVLTQTELLDEPSVIVADIGGIGSDAADNRIPTPPPAGAWNLA